MKVAYNGCYGGFNLSHAAIMRYAEIKGIALYPFVNCEDKDGRPSIRELKPATAADIQSAFIVHYCTTPEYSSDGYWSDRDIERDDPALIQVIEELGDKANGSCAQLEIDDVPAGVAYRIDEYDGNERVMQQDSYEWKIAR